MAFEQVKLRLPDGQEFGPAPFMTAVQWHREGRVPREAWLIDAMSGESRPVMDFPALAVAPPPMPGMPNMPMPGPAPITASDHLIPVKNPSSLAAYYISIVGMLCVLPIGVVALIFGIKGVKYAKVVGVGRTHSWVGIILGGLETLGFLGFWIFILISSHP